MSPIEHMCLCSMKKHIMVIAHITEVLIRTEELGPIRVQASQYSVVFMPQCQVRGPEGAVAGYC